MSYNPSIDLYNMIGGLGDNIVSNVKAYRQKQLLSDLGNDIVGGNYEGAAQKALQAGDMGTGLKLLELGRQSKNDAALQKYVSGGLMSLGQTQPTNPAAGASPSMDTTPRLSGDSAQDASLPRGMRNNNPGNIEDGPFAKSLPGYVGSDGRFAKFDTLDAGVNAHAQLLGRYGNKGIDTVSGVINRWAPSAENGAATGNYARFVANKLGVDPNGKIDLSNPETRTRLAYAMGEFENGRPIKGFAGAGDVPSQPAAPVRVAQAQTGGAPDIPLPIAIQMAGSSNPGMKALGEMAIKKSYEAASGGKEVPVTDPQERKSLGFGADDTRPVFRNTITGKVTALSESKAAENKAEDSKPRVVSPGGAIFQGGKEVYRNDGGANGTMPDQTADFLAERVLAGDTKALIGIGRGAQGSNNLAKVQGLVAQKAAERGIDAKDMLAATAEQSGLNAQQRTFGTQTARMSTSSVEAQGAITLGRQASQLVSRGNWVPVNRAIQAFQTNSGSPEISKFAAANLAIINTYARAINPNGQPTVADKEHAREMLSTAMGPDQYNAVLDQLNAEIEMAHKSPEIAKKGLENLRKGKPFMDGQHGGVTEGLTNAKPGAPVKSGQTSSGIKWSIE